MSYLIGRNRYASQTYPVARTAGSVPATENKVLVDSSDTTPGFLADKIVVGSGLTITVLNPGADEQLQIGLFQALSITSFTTPTTLLEIGQALATPSFSAAYNVLPDSAVLSDSEDNPTQNFVSPFTAIVSTHSYTKTAIGTGVTWTDTAASAVHGGASRSVSAVWGARNYYGVSTPGGTTESFIKALPSSLVEISRVVPNFTVDVTVGNSLYYANPTSEGTPLLFDNVTGFQIDMTVVSTTIAVTNSFGQTVNYTLQQSTFTGIGNLTVRVQ